MNLYYAPVLGTFAEIKKRAFVKRVFDRYLKNRKAKTAFLKRLWFSLRSFFLALRTKFVGVVKRFNPNHR